MFGVLAFSSQSLWHTAGFLIQVLFSNSCLGKEGFKNASLFFRYDERRGIASSGTWVPHANSTKLSTCIIRNHAGMLAQGPSQEANVRDAPMEIRGLFHHVWLGIQRRHSLLNNHWCFTKPAAFLFLHFKNQVFSTTLCYPHPLIMKWHNKRHTYFTQYDIELQAKPISGCDISSLSLLPAPFL